MQTLCKPYAPVHLQLLIQHSLGALVLGWIPSCILSTGAVPRTSTVRFVEAVRLGLGGNSSKIADAFGEYLILLNLTDGE